VWSIHAGLELRQPPRSQVKYESRSDSLAVPVAHATAREVVRAHLYPHSVSKQDPDPEPAHLATRVGEQLMPVVQTNGKLRVRMVSTTVPSISSASLLGIGSHPPTCARPCVVAAAPESGLPAAAGNSPVSSGSGCNHQIGFRHHAAGSSSNSTPACHRWAGTAPGPPARSPSTWR